MTVHTENVHIFGSDDDALYIGASTIDLSDVTLFSDLPEGMVDCGWLSDDGATLQMEDSTSALQGHQGHADVVKYMDSSSTSFTAVLIEDIIQLSDWYFDAASVRKTDANPKEGFAADYVEQTVKKARAIKHLVAVWDTFDTAHDGVKYRYVFPAVDLAERDNHEMKVGEFSAFSWTMPVMADYRRLTNAKGMLPAAGGDFGG